MRRSQLTVRLETHHEVLQTAQYRQETPEFTAQYALPAGVESNLSQGVRRFDLGQSRYRGFARAHLQQLFTTTAMNVVRVMTWLWGEPLGEHWRSPGHCAQLSPYPLSCQTVLCYGRLTQQSQAKFANGRRACTRCMSSHWPSAALHLS
jgi:hypothetical protein